MIARLFRSVTFRSVTPGPVLGSGLLLLFSGSLFFPVAAPTDCPQSPPPGKASTFSDLLNRKPCQTGLASKEMSKEILAWSKTAPRLSLADSGLGLALGALPHLGSSLWREAGENRLAQGDTASAGLLWLRGAASDSQFIRYAQYRIKTVLQPPAQNEEMAGKENRTRSQAPHLTQTSPILPWLIPWSWHNANSTLALEQGLWSAHSPEAAMRALRLRLRTQSAGRESTAWLHAGQTALESGRPDLAMEALAALEALRPWEGINGSNDPKRDVETLAFALTVTWMHQNYGKAGVWVEHYTPRLPAMASQGGMTFEIRCLALEAALRDGRLHLGSKWLAPPWPKSESERHDLFQARQYLGSGQTEKARRLLEKLKQSPRERFSNGTLLYALGWVAGWQAQAKKADSLWALASAYTDLPETQRALELRGLALLDTGKTFGFIIQGQPEAPLPVLQKIAILQDIPKNSPFWPEAQWQMAAYVLGMGRFAEARQCYQDLVKSAGHSRHQAAKARLAFLTETQDTAKAIAAFQNLLVESQQGVPAEFSRERLRQLGL